MSTAQDQDKAPVLISHEWEVLEMLAGEREGQWGAWVGACCERLRAIGYANYTYRITEAGRAALANRKAGGA